MKSEAQTRPSITPNQLDLLMIVFLIGFDVAARLLLHTWNVSPVAASALFAGLMLRRRWLALLVPLAALALSDLFIAGDDWRVKAVVYAALMLPALAGIVGRDFGTSARVIVPAALGCSLTFFAATNFAVWAFSGMYSHDMAGLIACYVAALPFLKYTIAGDLFWCAVFFGGAWLVQRMSARTAGLIAQR